MNFDRMQRAHDRHMDMIRFQVGERVSAKLMNDMGDQVWWQVADQINGEITWLIYDHYIERER